MRLTTAKILLLVFLAGLVVRVTVLAFWLPALNPQVDMDSYRSLARNLAVGKGFVAPTSTNQELPGVARTPGYPLLLAALIKLGGDRLGLFLFVQCLIGAAVCALTALLARRWLPDMAALIAGLLIAFDPNSVMRCIDLRTETLFTMLLLVGAWLLTVRQPRAVIWGLAGLVWSLAALVRPIAVWVWIIALLAIAVFNLPRGQRGTAMMIFLIGFLLPVSVWMGRNLSLTGRPFVSTIATYNLLVYRAAGVQAQQTHTVLSVVQGQLARGCGDIEFFEDRDSFQTRLACARQTALSILRSNPLLALRQTVIGWGKILIGPGTHSLDNSLQKLPSPSPKWMARCYALALIAAWVLAAWGCVRLGRSAFLPAALIVYFVSLAGGPEANSRFRTPITPLLAILVAGAFVRKSDAVR